MKRTREESTAEGAFKHPRLENQISPAIVNFFPEDSELKAGELANAKVLPEQGHIVGHVFMLWPATKNNRKLQLKMGSDSLDVVFQGSAVEKLDFVSKDIVRIALKGGRKEPKQAGSSLTLPFKLVFPDGAIVQMLASQKREKDKLVDLFQAAEDDKRRAEDDWFCTPADLRPIEQLDTVNQASATLEAGYPLVDWSDFSKLSPATSSPISHRRHDVPYEVDNEDHRDNSEQNKHQKDLRVHVDSSRTVIHDLAKENIRRDPLQSANTPVSCTPPAPLHPPSSQPLSTHNKNKRIKKRDTRHSRKSNGSPVSENALDIQNPSDPDAQKPLGKKARQRQAARLKQERDSVKAQPPHDPALDLEPGFHSNKGGLYVPLGKIVAGKPYSLVGVVTDVSSTKTTRTGERSKSFILVDPSCHGSRGLTVNVFVSQADEELLPSAKPDQVLLLRNVKVKEYSSSLQGTCYKDSFHWCGYDPALGKPFYTITDGASPSGRRTSMSEFNHEVFFRVTAAELEYFVKISDWWRALKEAEEKHSTPGSDSSNTVTHIVPRRLGGRQKLAIISEMEQGIFADCVVELLKVWQNEMNTEILVTDYSENKHLQHHTETSRFPFGQRTLKVILWDGAHAMAEDLELHSFYLLENMRLKASGVYLEGSIGYQDRGIRKIGPGSTQDNYPELLQRKKEYRDDPYHSRIQPDEKPSEIIEAVQQGHDDVRKELSAISQNTGIVKCSHMDQRCSSIEEVQRCQMCPNRFRVRARIVDYYPQHIRNFVSAQCNGCNKLLDDGHRLCPECADLSESSTTVRYQFALRVADESGAELNIGVSDKEADTFLSGLSAKDARDDVEALTRRLSPILGHLDGWHETFEEEAKVEPGPWLNVCVYSWVAEEGEPVRLYKLFGCQLCTPSC